MRAPWPRWHEAVLVAHMGLVAALVPFLVRSDLRRLQGLLEPRRPAAASATVDEEAAAIAWRVDQVIRNGWPLVRPGCLTRGITSYYFLRRSGADVELCFGVGATHSPGRPGHCWIASKGRPLLEVVDPRILYREVARLSASGVTGSRGSR